jgi:hypothetical protein
VSYIVIAFWGLVVGYIGYALYNALNKKRRRISPEYVYVLSESDVRVLLGKGYRAGFTEVKQAETYRDGALDLETRVDKYSKETPLDLIADYRRKQ